MSMPERHLVNANYWAQDHAPEKRLAVHSPHMLISNGGGYFCAAHIAGQCIPKLYKS